MQQFAGVIPIKPLNTNYKSDKNHIIKVLCNQSNKKTRLQPLCYKLEVLNTDRIYKLEVHKFMVKV